MVSESPAESLLKIRDALRKAFELDIVGEESRSIYEATFISIFNECENQRQRNVAVLNSLRQQVRQAEANVNAYSQMSSILFSVINGFISNANKEADEEALKELSDEEEAEDEEIRQKLLKSVKEKKSSKKKRKKTE